MGNEYRRAKEEPELSYQEHKEARDIGASYYKGVEIEYDGTGHPGEAAAKTIGRGNGGATSYYEIPKGATELKHLIKHKRMEHAIGEAFCALYRLKDNGEYLRNLVKVKYYIDSEIEWAKYNG